MIGRNIVPDEALVLETCETLIGSSFRGVVDDGATMHFVAESAPSLGMRVLYLTTAGCDYSTCVWAADPWAT